jgi:hypothetical protein
MPFCPHACDVKAVAPALMFAACVHVQGTCQWSLSRPTADTMLALGKPMDEGTDGWQVMSWLPQLSSSSCSLFSFRFSHRTQPLCPTLKPLVAAASGVLGHGCCAVMAGSPQTMPASPHDNQNCLETWIGRMPNAVSSMLLATTPAAARMVDPKPQIGARATHEAGTSETDA